MSVEETPSPAPANDAEPFDQGAPTPPVDDETQLVLDLDGYDGPLDVLLTLARDQKVDLAKISILQLAEQYLAFVERVRQKHLEIAADYLVMAAWLAYLKSRILLPEPTVSKEEPSGAEMAAALTFQLQRLEAMQAAGARLCALPRLGIDVFGRGAPEPAQVVEVTVWDVTLYDLLRAYGDQRRRSHVTTLTVEAQDLYSVDMALSRLETMLGQMPDWETLSRFLPPSLKGSLLRRSAMSATFVASLEMVRLGKLDLRQDMPFGPIYLRRRENAPDANDNNDQVP